ncbi:unnamed protein product [Alternaria burnsii]|nr:unnamed protein product [Alternaria burnsii]
MTCSLSLLTNTTRQNIAIATRPALYLIPSNAICLDTRAISIRQIREISSNKMLVVTLKTEEILAARILNS